MSGYNEQHATTMLNALQGTDTLERYKKEIISDTIEEIIKKIENEISNSSQTRYICEDGEIISTDVGYVEEWFEKYKLKLKDRSK